MSSNLKITHQKLKRAKTTLKTASKAALLSERLMKNKLAKSEKEVKKLAKQNTSLFEMRKKTSGVHSKYEVGAHGLECL